MAVKYVSIIPEDINSAKKGNLINLDIFQLYIIMSDNLETIYQTLKSNGIKVLDYLFKSQKEGAPIQDIINTCGIKNENVFEELKQLKFITDDTDPEGNNKDIRCFIIPGTSERLIDLANKHEGIRELINTSSSLREILDSVPIWIGKLNEPTTRVKREKSVIDKIENVLDEKKRTILRVFFSRTNEELKNGIRMTYLEEKLKAPTRSLQSHLDELVESHLLNYKPDPPKRGEPKTYFLNNADDLTVRENYDTESVLRAWKYAFQCALVNDVIVRETGQYSNRILIVESDDVGNKGENSPLLIWSTFDPLARPYSEELGPGPALPVYVVYPIIKNERIRIGRGEFKRKPESDDTDELGGNIRNIKFLECSNNVGREHAEIYIHSDYYSDQIMLKDISSDQAVKTIVITTDGAEKEMEVGKGKEVVIEDGDKIRIENLTFEIASHARYSRKEFVKYKGSDEYEGRFKIVLVPMEKLYCILNPAAPRQL